MQTDQTSSISEQRIPLHVPLFDRGDADLAFVGLLTGLVTVVGAWTLAGAGAPPLTGAAIAAIHRDQPLLLLADLVPFVTLGLCLAYAREIRRTSIYRRALEDAPDATVVATPATVPLVAHGLVSIDLENRVVEMNPAAEIIFGRPSRELRGARLETILPRELQGVCDASCVRTASGDVIGHAWQTDGLHADGSRLELLISIAAQRTGHLTWITIDPAPAEAKGPSLPDGRFLSALARELRAPVNLVMAYSTLATQDEAEASAEQLRRDLDRVRNATHRVRMLADDLLELSRLADESEVELSLESVDLRDLVQAAVRDATQVEAGYSGQLHPATVRGRPLAVQTDPTKVRRIVHALVTSVCRIARPGTVEVDVDCTDRSISIRVSGRAHDGAEPSMEAPGLALSQRLVSALGGHLVASGPATWELVLPRHRVSDPNAMEDSETRPLDPEAWDLPIGAGASLTQPIRLGEATDFAAMAPGFISTPPDHDRHQASVPPLRAPGRPRVILIDADARRRDSASRGLSARGLWVSAAAGDGPARYLATIAGTTLLAIQTREGSVWPLLRKLGSDPLLAGLPLALIDLDGSTGHLLRTDSFAERSMPVDRLLAMSKAQRSGVVDPVSFVLGPEGSERNATAAILRRAGWTTLADHRVDQLVESVRRTPVQLVIVDALVQDCGAALAALHRAADRVGHVCLLLPPPGHEPQLVVSPDDKVSASEVFDQVAHMAHSARSDSPSELELA